MDDVVVDKSVLALISPAVAHKYALLPVYKTPDGTLRVVVAAWNARVMDVASKIATAHRLRVAPAVATEAPLRAAIEQWYGPDPGARASDVAGPAAAARSAMPVVTTPRPSPPSPVSAQAPARASSVFAGAAASNATARSGNSALLTPSDDAAGDQSVVIQFINRILTHAIADGASDVHFEPRRDGLDIRFRQDGTLRNVDSVGRGFQDACTSRLKIMAEMNIAERRLPQDGRISAVIEGRSVDMRVSSLPTQYGESVVLRILDKNGVRPQLDQLGFSDRNLLTLGSLIRKPHGIFLATGPTGSGKTNDAL